MRNIGDAINLDVIHYLSGKQPYFSMDDQLEHLVGIGSIFFMATRKSHIWGTGIMDPAQDISALEPKQVHAVRGKLTRDILRAAFPGIHDFPLGDPGVFIEELPLVRSFPRDVVSGKVVVMPNHRFSDSEYFIQLARNHEVFVLHPATNKLDVLMALKSADIVVSQSLHGLVFAEALGRPWCWISHTDNPAWTFKFRDWLSTTHEPYRTASPFGTPLSVLIRNAHLSGLSCSKGSLREALPNLSANPRVEIGYRELRARSPIVFVVSQGRFGCPDFHFDRMIVAQTGDNEKIKAALNDFQSIAADVFHCLLVFDEVLFSSMTFRDIADLRAILDSYHDLRFVQFLPNKFRSNASTSVSVRNDVRICVVETWTEQHDWHGVVLLRNTFNYRLDERGLSVFSG